jgi:hypothetical protein
MSKLPEMTAYYNNAMDITLAVPVGWTGKVLAPQAFRIYGPPEPKFNNQRATLSVEKVDLREDADEAKTEYGSAAMDELVTQAQADLKGELHEFLSLREERHTTAAGLLAYSRWFHWTDPDAGTVHAQIQAFLLTPAGDLYIFNAATLKALESQYTPIFEHIIRSAKIT